MQGREVLTLDAAAWMQCALLLEGGCFQDVQMHKGDSDHYPYGLH